MSPKGTAASLIGAAQLLDDADVPVLFIGPEGELAGLTRAAARVCGGSVDAVMEAGVQGLGLARDARFEAILQRDLRKTLPSTDLPILRLDGSRTGVHVNAYDLADGSGWRALRLHGIDEDTDEVRWWRKEVDRYRIALDAAGIGAWDMDLLANETRRTMLHDACFGYEHPVESWGYETFLSHVIPEDRDRVDRAYMAAMRGGGEYDIEFRVRWPDGSIHWLWSKGQFYLDRKGNPVHVAGLQAEVTKRRETEEARRLANRAIEASSVGVVVADARAPDLPMVSVNPAFEEMTGYEASEVIGFNCRFLQGQQRDQDALDELRACLAEGRDAQVLLRNFRKNGEPFWNRLRIAPIHDEAGEISHMVGIQMDVTSEIEAREALVRQATQDQLTGLPNLRAFNLYLAEILEQDPAGTEDMALLFLDIDHFKRFNNQFGHAGGDLVLQAIGERIGESISESAMAARVGGDEFAIVLANADGETGALAAAKAITRNLSRPVTIGNAEALPSVSVGVALFGSHGRTVAELMRHADSAMYEVKRLGRSDARIYNPATDDTHDVDIDLENRLRNGIARGELQLHYQPQYTAAERRVVGLEALLRWYPTVGESVSPGRFIPAAERTGLIFDLGDWVLGQACRQIRTWREAGVETVPVAINLSTVQFRRGDMGRKIHQALAENQLEGSALEIEVTETVAVDESEDILETMRYLHELGVRIAIDDFGTGFSNLSLLRQCPFDHLKIDTSFVAGAPTSAADAAICTVTVSLAHAFGQKVVAEGVETDETLELMCSLGCDEVQGFYFSPAVDGERIPEMLGKAGA